MFSASLCVLVLVAELGPVVWTHVVGDSVDPEQVDKLCYVGSTQGH